MSKGNEMSKKERREAQRREEQRRNAARKKARLTRTVIIVALISVVAVVSLILIFKPKSESGENGGSSNGLGGTSDGVSNSSDGIDYDLASLDGLMKYSAFINIVNDPYLYESKTLRIDGINDPYYLSEADKWYQFLRIEGDVCCAEYMMFRTKDDSYPDDFPQGEAPLTVTGVLRNYHDTELGNLMWYLEVIEFSW